MNAFKYFVVVFQVCLFLQINAEISNAPVEKSPKIIKIDSFSQIDRDQPKDTIYFIDLSDTLIDSAGMLGSKSWRKYITEATSYDKTANWHDIFTLFVAKNYPHKTVESTTSQFVKTLQAKGYPVFGLTGRERNVWYNTPETGIDVFTIKQLETIGIKLNSSSLDQSFSYLIKNPSYYEGVFFADVEPKGEYLYNLFKNAPQLPKKVIFIDAKLSQVESASSALSKLGIPHEIYLFTATDSKVGKFSPLLANIQLYYLWTSAGNKVLSDEEAESIAKQFPERDSSYYLQAVLENAKSKLLKK